MGDLLSMEALESSICRESFYEFVKRFWFIIIPERPVWNWHIKYLCDELQVMAERVIREEDKEYDLIINIPPGTTKSTICSVMFTPWIWTRMPTARAIYGTHTAPLSLDLSRKARMIVASQKYKDLFPEIVLSDDQATKGHFVNTMNGARLATMVGGAITGFHAHFIFVDDPLDPQGAASSQEIVTANNWMSETLPTRKIDKGIAVTTLIMQRLHQADCTGELLAQTKAKLKHICLPAELSNKVSPVELRDRYVDGLLDPKRLSAEILAEMADKLGEFGYAAQFDQSPVPRGGGEFKTGRIEIEMAPPNKFKRKVRYWDKAGTRGGGAYTVGVLMGVDKNGFVWVLDVVRGQWDSFDREQILKQTAKMDGVSTSVYVEQEPGSGGKESAENTIKSLIGFKVYADRPTGDKETRAEPFAVQVNGANVKMLKAAWNKVYLDELMYWPASKYKDQVDASSGAFAKVIKGKRRAGAL